jgi:PAS domain S-box-containing protein
VVCSSKDITERKRMEDALRASEALQRSLLEWSLEAVAIHRDGRLLYVNAAAIKMMGAASAQQLVGTSLLDRVHPDFHPTVAERTRNRSAPGVSVPMIEETFLRLDGTPVDVEVQGTNIVFEGAPATYVSVRDITERKRIEKALRASEERLQTVFKSSPAGITVSRVSDGKILDANDSALRLYGYSRDEVIGRTVAELKTYADAGQREEMVRRLREHGQLDHFTVDFRHQSGKVGVLEASGRFIELQGTAEHDPFTRDELDAMRKLAEKGILDLLAAQKAVIAQAKAGMLVTKSGRGARSGV